MTMWNEDLVEILEQARKGVCDEMVCQNLLLQSLLDEQRVTMGLLVGIVRKIMDAKQIDPILADRLVANDIDLSFDPVVMH